MSLTPRTPYSLALSALAGLLALGGCVSLAPEVRIADRHTVLEEDASGQWPKLEERFGADMVRMGPVPLAEDPVRSRRRQWAFSVLNGAFVNPAPEGNGT